MIIGYIFKVLIVVGLGIFATHECVQLVKSIKSRIENKKNTNLENKE